MHSRGEMGIEEVVKLLIFLAILIVLVILVFVFKEKLFDLGRQLKEFVRFI